MAVQCGPETRSPLRVAVLTLFFKRAEEIDASC